MSRAIPLISPAVPKISLRESQILRLAQRGLSNKQLACALKLSVATVKQRLRILYVKLGACNRTQLALIAKRIGLASNKRSLRAAGCYCQISRREFDTFCLIRRAMSNKEIAATLGVSIATVKQYLRALYLKFGVHNRTQLALAAAHPKKSVLPEAHTAARIPLELSGGDRRAQKKGIPAGFVVGNESDQLMKSIAARSTCSVDGSYPYPSQGRHRI